MKHVSSEESTAAQRGPLFPSPFGRLESRATAGGYAHLTIGVDRALDVPRPGQFMLLRLREGPTLPRAFSVMAAGEGSLEFLVKLDGTLREALGRAAIGTEIMVRGPYGTPYANRIPRDRSFVLAGGGSGMAPLLHFAAAHPRHVAALAFGVRSRGVRELLPGVDLAVEEEDGETAQDRLQRCRRPGVGILACGPEPMLRGIARRYGNDPDTYVSLEARIGCGFGACQGCSIETSTGMQRICREGPLFACSEVPWLR